MAARPSPSEEPGKAPERVPRVDRRLVVKACLGLAGLVAAAYLCGALLREPITAAGRGALSSLGLPGLFVGVIVTDASPLPLTNEPLVLLAVSAGVSAWVVFGVVSAASVTAGIVGYGGGALVGARTPVGPWIRRRYPGFGAFMERWGATGVALCAFLPIPFALSTWSAGMARIGLLKVALASLVRIPKTAFYVWLIVEGWRMGAS